MATRAAGETRTGWQHEVYDLLRRHAVTQFGYVPDAGHSILIERSLTDPDVHSIALTTEEEGVALLAGADLGGERGVLLMQSSGVGNCINTLGMMKTCQFPFLTIVTMRGEFGEFNPWQVPMGTATPASLEIAGVVVHRASEAARVGEVVAGAARIAFSSYCAVAVLLPQELIGAKTFGK